MKKRILSMMTALCLMLALFPVTAFAETPIYNASNIHGIKPWKEYCGDTFFTIDIPTEKINRVEYINRRPGSLPRVSDKAIDWERYIENRKSSVRCKVEHAFRIIKCQFGYSKTAYRGLHILQFLKKKMATTRNY